MALADTLFSSLQSALQSVEQQYRTKFEEQEQTIKFLQKRVDELEHYEDFDDILDEIEQQEENESKYQSPPPMDDNEEEKDDKKKTSNFWIEVNKALEDSNLEFIKNLVRMNQIKMHETNGEGRNLLMLAAQFGSYELASMCINLGANVDTEDNDKQTALNIAKKKGN